MMKLVDKKKATATLAAYAEQLAGGPVVLTERGKPVAALVALENVDLETVSQSTNPQFLELIERSRRRVRAKGGVSSAEMRRRFDKRKPKKRVAWQCFRHRVPGRATLRHHGIT